MKLVLIESTDLFTTKLEQAAQRDQSAKEDSLKHGQLGAHELAGVNQDHGHHGLNRNQFHLETH